MRIDSEKEFETGTSLSEIVLIKERNRKAYVKRFKADKLFLVKVIFEFNFFSSRSDWVDDGYLSELLNERYWIDYELVVMKKIYSSYQI